MAAAEVPFIDSRRRFFSLKIVLWVDVGVRGVGLVAPSEPPPFGVVVPFCWDEVGVLTELVGTGTAVPLLGDANKSGLTISCLASLVLVGGFVRLIFILRICLSSKGA